MDLCLLPDLLPQFLSIHSQHVGPRHPPDYDAYEASNWSEIESGTGEHGAQRSKDGSEIVV
jgi:hypothetical protein